MSSALAIIIPEGVKSIHQSVSEIGSSSRADDMVGLAIVAGFMFMYVIDQSSALWDRSRMNTSYIEVDNLQGLENYAEHDLARVLNQRRDTLAALTDTLGFCKSCSTSQLRMS